MASISSNILEPEVEIVPEAGLVSLSPRNTSSVVKPMAPKKLATKCYKLIRKALAEHKTYVRNGPKEVQKRIRKGERGIVIFAGDAKPVDNKRDMPDHLVDSKRHMPAVCENLNIPYCYVPSRMALGAALNMKRESVMVLIREKEEYKELFDKVKEEISCLLIVL